MSKQRLIFLIILVAAAAAAFFSFTQFKKKNPSVASFKNMSISREDFIKRVNSLPLDLRAVAAQRRKDFVEEMIDERLLEEEALRRGLDRDPVVKELMSQARTKILLARLLDTEVSKKASVTPEEAQTIYEANKDKFTTPELFRASHILVATAAEAEEIKRKVVWEGGDFEAMAREKSTHRSAAAGGDIGFFAKGQLIPELETAILALKKGEVGGPVQTKFGYHVVKLTDRTTSEVKDFEMVKDTVEKRVLAEKRARLLKEFTKQLRGGAPVTVDEASLNAIQVKS